MSTKSRLYHSIECDFPDCGANAQEGGDYSSWADVDAAVDEARDYGWISDERGDYCILHVVYDEELEATRPMTAELTDAMAAMMDSVTGRIESAASAAIWRIDQALNGRFDRQLLLQWERARELAKASVPSEARMTRDAIYRSMGLHA
jgi:hypothetical protein